MNWQRVGRWATDVALIVLVVMWAGLLLSTLLYMIFG